MLWVTQLLYYLPSAALGGILIASAWGLCDFGEFARLWRFRGISLAGALVTLVGVVALGVMEGILVGVVFSLVLLLRALAFPADAVLGRTPDGGWHDPHTGPTPRPCPACWSTASPRRSSSPTARSSASASKRWSPAPPSR